MDPITAVSLVSSVVSMADIIARTVNGLITLQARYKSADTDVIMIMGHLQIIESALEEIREWIENLGNSRAYIRLLSKIDFAVSCFAIPLKALHDRINRLQRRPDGGELSKRGKLVHLLGEREVRTMTAHLGNVVPALNLLLTATAWSVPKTALFADADQSDSKSQHETTQVLQNDQAQSLFRQIRDDSSSYIQPEHDSLSTRIPPSPPDDAADLPDLTFQFDDDLFVSQVYRNAHRSKRESQKGYFSRSGDSTDLSSATESKSDGPVRPQNLKTSCAVSNTYPQFALPSRTNSAPIKVRDPEDMAPRNPSRKLERSSTAPLSASKLVNKETNSPRMYRMPMILRFLSGKKAQSDVSKPDLSKLSDIRRILVLGVGIRERVMLMESLKIKYKGPYEMSERDKFKAAILDALVQEVGQLQTSPDSKLHASLQPRGPRAFPARDSESRSGSRAQMERTVSELRKTPEFQRQLSHLRKYASGSPCLYILENAKRISGPEYVPSDMDILTIHDRSSQPDYLVFSVDQTMYRIWNAGGRPPSRESRKCFFENPSVIFFPVDISDYEPSSTGLLSTLQTSLALFATITNLERLSKSRIVLLLDRVNNFRVKLRRVPLSKIFPDYAGTTAEEAEKYVLNLFASLGKRHRVDAAFVNLEDQRQMSDIIDSIEVF